MKKILFTFVLLMIVLSGCSNDTISSIIDEKYVGARTFAGKFTNLSDVDTTGANDGEFISYQASTATWVPDAADELYTDQVSVYIQTPVVESLDNLFGGFMNDVTITYVKCITGADTATINFEDGGSNDILSADLVCDVDGQTSCASGCDVNTINGDYDNITAKTEAITYDASAVGTPLYVSIMIGFTIDD